MRDQTSKAKSKDWYSDASLDRDTRTTPFGHDSSIPDHSENAHSEEHPQPQVQATEQALHVLQTVKRHYCQAVDCRTYRHASRAVC